MRNFFNCCSESPLLKYTFLIFAFVTFFGCSNDDDSMDVNPDEEEILESYESYLVAHYELNGDFKDSSPNDRDATLIGTFKEVEGVNGTAVFLNEIDSTNLCGMPGGSFIQLPTIEEVWEEGFTVTAWTKFTENRYFERIIDFGNGLGEQGGYPITLSRNDTLNDLILTSWISNNSIVNREKGRLTAKNAIKNGELQFIAATISPSGKMKIYIDGVLVAEKSDGHGIMNVTRTQNFIGHSNYCKEDDDFRGLMDEVRIYNKNLPIQEIERIYNIR